MWQRALSGSGGGGGGNLPIVATISSDNKTISATWGYDADCIILTRRCTGTGGSSPNQIQIFIVSRATGEWYLAYNLYKTSSTQDTGNFFRMTTPLGSQSNVSSYTFDKRSFSITFSDTTSYDVTITPLSDLPLYLFS